MFHNLDDLVACGKAPFGSRQLRSFASVVVEVEEVFGHRHVRKLVDDTSYRREVMSLIRNQALVPRDEHQSADDVWSIYREEAATIMFRYLHQHAPSVAAVCQELADALGMPMHASGYLTPARSQGLPVHSDVDSVYALQLKGIKNWEAFRPLVADPADERMGRVFRDEEARSLKLEFTVHTRVGGVVFIPRGVPHRAVADSRLESLHVSFGILHPEMDSRAFEEQRPVMPRA